MGGDVGDLEESKIGPALQLNPGPPFAVGDVIMCDVPGHALGMDPIRNSTMSLTTLVLCFFYLSNMLLGS
jgi:hypothetical protein